MCVAESLSVRDGFVSGGSLLATTLPVSLPLSLIFVDKARQGKARQGGTLGELFRGAKSFLYGIFCVSWLTSAVGAASTFFVFSFSQTLAGARVPLAARFAGHSTSSGDGETCRIFARQNCLLFLAQHRLFLGSGGLETSWRWTSTSGALPADVCCYVMLTKSGGIRECFPLRV